MSIDNKIKLQKKIGKLVKIAHGLQDGLKENSGNLPSSLVQDQ